MKKRAKPLDNACSKNQQLRAELNKLLVSRLGAITCVSLCPPPPPKKKILRMPCSFCPCSLYLNGKGKEFRRALNI
jgi:hypothetical protein